MLTRPFHAQKIGDDDGDGRNPFWGVREFNLTFLCTRECISSVTHEEQRHFACLHGLACKLITESGSGGILQQWRY